MNKTYEKPMLLRREMLSKVTADVPSGVVVAAPE
jgi:hypothetical protein